MTEKKTGHILRENALKIWEPSYNNIEGKQKAFDIYLNAAEQGDLKSILILQNYYHSSKILSHEKMIKLYRYAFEKETIFSSKAWIIWCLAQFYIELPCSGKRFNSKWVNDNYIHGGWVNDKRDYKKYIKCLDELVNMQKDYSLNDPLYNSKYQHIKNKALIALGKIYSNPPNDTIKKDIIRAFEYWQRHWDFKTYFKEIMTNPILYFEYVQEQIMRLQFAPPCSNGSGGIMFQKLKKDFEDRSKKHIKK